MPRRSPTLLLLVLLLSTALAKAADDAPSRGAGGVSAHTKHHALGLVEEQDQYVLNLSPTISDTNSTGIRYRPNILTSSGFQATVYDLTAEYKTNAARDPSQDAKKGVTSYDDIRLSTSFGSQDQWVVSTYYTRYAGLYIENSADVDPSYNGTGNYIQRSDLSIFNYGASLMYVWNPEKFSVAAALFQSARQTQSGGSPLLMAAFDGSQFYANSSIIPAQLQSQYGQDANLTGGRFSTGSVSVGYGYTLTSGGFFLTALGLIGPGHQWRQYTSSGVSYTTDANSTKALVAASLGYNGESLYTAMTFTDSQTENETQSVRLKPEFQQLRLVLGWRF